MIKKLCLFILLVAFSKSVLAEYYLVYTPPQCDNCAREFAPLNYVSSHKAKKKPIKKHHVLRHAAPRKHLLVKHKPAKQHVQANACGQCETCICGPGYVISTSQPEFYGEYCTTYDEVVRGNP